MFIYIILSLLMFIICLADIFRKIDISSKKWFVPYITLVPHFPLVWYYFFNTAINLESVSEMSIAFFFAFSSAVFIIYTFCRLHISWIRKNKTNSIRVNIVYAGRNLMQCGLFGLYALLVWYFLCFLVFPHNPYAPLFGHNFELLNFIDSSIIAFAALTFEISFALVYVWSFIINGALRIFIFSRNMLFWKRLLLVIFIWFPFANIYLAHLLLVAAKDEYLVTYSRDNFEAVAASDDPCKTKYPIIMVHGIGFRDLKFRNYWGRIPQVLSMHGAQVYYGNQLAWSTIEDSADFLAKIVDQVLEENECEKVNLIAHSRGGLDCRYLISTLGYGDKIASLTTLSAPHRGSELISFFFEYFPEKVNRFIINQLSRPFSVVTGEDTSDNYIATKQLLPSYCEEFNKLNPDVEGVYYQSYASIMHNCFSDSLLAIPYLIMCTQKGRLNDGMVDVSSAIWGNFKGVLTSRKNRGISHGDMIDLKHEDINGFDVLKLFYDIASDLKARDF